MKILRYFVLMLIFAASFEVSAGSCGGFVLFAGYGYDDGPKNYEIQNDFMGNRYRDHNQGVYGIEYNWRYFRIQHTHSSSLDNGENASFGDLNMTSFLFKYNF